MKGQLVREYAVLESGAICYTMEMAKMMKWFERILGWYAQADRWDDEGRPVHAVVTPAPAETAALALHPFTGLHLLEGEPERRAPALIRVDNLSKLYERAVSAGWTRLTEPEETSWEGIECEVETPEGCRLIFYQFD